MSTTAPTAPSVPPQAQVPDYQDLRKQLNDYTTTFYGPHSCEGCGIYGIVKASAECGSQSWEQKETSAGFIYKPHHCTHSALFRSLSGKILTVLEAALANPEQRWAVSDLVRQEVRKSLTRARELEGRRPKTITEQGFTAPIEIESALDEIESELRVKFPLVHILQVGYCNRCHCRQHLYQVYDSATGMPKMQYGVYLLSYGDGTSPWLKGGVISSGDNAVVDHGNGCFGVSLDATLFFTRFSLNLLSDLRKKIFSLAEEITNRSNEEIPAAG